MAFWIRRGGQRMCRLEMTPEFLKDVMQQPEKQPNTQPVDVAGHSGVDAEQIAQPAIRHVQSLIQLTASQRRIISHVGMPRSLVELITHTGYTASAPTSRPPTSNRLTVGIFRITVPDKPCSFKQRLLRAAVRIKFRAWCADQQATT
jgi:hypothetical protein